MAPFRTKIVGDEMGGFYFSTMRQDDTAALHVFSKNDLPINKQIRTNQFEFTLFGKKNIKEENIIEFQDGSFLASVGTFIFSNAVGVSALRELNKYLNSETSIDIILKEKAQGNYCIIIYINHKVYIFNDSAGLYHVYFSEAGGVTVTSSFLSIIASLPEKNLSRLEAYEYLMTGAVYGGKTLCRQVSLLDGTTYLVIDCQTETHNILPRTDSIPQINTNEAGFEEVTSEILAKLRAYFSMVKANFDGQIIADMSGGHDTRLLACLLKDQKIRHKIRVSQYLNNHEDPEIAKQISEGENIPLTISDNREKPNETVLLREKLSSAYYLCDGIGTELFPWGLSLDTYLHETTQGVRLALAGTGGENFRAYGKWFRKKSTLIKKFVHDHFYLDFLDPQFQEEFLQHMVRKIQSNLTIDRQILLPKEPEILYQTFRVRYWSGRGVSIYNMFTYFLIPFTEQEIALLGLAARSQYKEFSRLQIELMKNLDIPLTKYPSDQGYTFYDMGKAKYRWNRKIKMAPRNIIDLWGLTKYLRYIKRNITRKKYHEVKLDIRFWEKIFGDKRIMAQEFQLSKWPHELVLSRFISLEYLIRSSGLKP